MKKVLILVLTINILFLFVGCTKQETVKPEPTTTQKIAQDTLPSDKENRPVATFDFSKLEKEINNITRQITNAECSNLSSENEKAFYQYNKKLQQFEYSLDQIEDDFEKQYENGTISFDEYKNQMKNIDQLENKADLAEDALENKYGMDD